MARPGGLSATQLSAVRTVAGVIAADSSTLTDANIPPASALDCRGFKTVWLGVEIAGGVSPTATLEVLVRDADAADGSRWKKLLVGSAPGVTLAAAASQKTSALDGTSLVEVRVDGRSAVFFRIDVVTNPGSTTSITILAMGGEPRSAQSRWA
jgi:hypothetical protein